MTRPMEFYETPAGLVEELMESGLVKLNQSDRILDPCSGEHALIDALVAWLSIHDLSSIRIYGNDVDTSRKRALLHEDATTDRGWRNMTRLLDRPHWVITNTPFSKAHWIIPHALDHALEGVAMLLPLRFKEPTGEREKILKERPWSAEIVFGQPRPSFTTEPIMVQDLFGDQQLEKAGGTDNQTTFWAIWRRDLEPMRLIYATGGKSRWAEFKRPWRSIPAGPG